MQPPQQADFIHSHLHNHRLRVKDKSSSPAHTFPLITMMLFKFLLLVLSTAIDSDILALAFKTTGAGGGATSRPGNSSLRTEINDFATSGPAFDLYILALQRLQDTDQTDQLSYFQVSGLFVMYEAVAQTKSQQEFTATRRSRGMVSLDTDNTQDTACMVPSPFLSGIDHISHFSKYVLHDVARVELISFIATRIWTCSNNRYHLSGRSTCKVPDSSLELTITILGLGIECVATSGHHISYDLC